MTYGYSGTPLWKKLGLKPGHRLLLEHAPEGFLPQRPEDVRAVDHGPADVIVAFHTERSGVQEAVPRLRAEMEPNAGLWIAWPKRASKVETDVTEDVVREIALRHRLVDNKVCAVDEVWSGLRLVIRLTDR